MWPWNAADVPGGLDPWTTSPDIIRNIDLIEHTSLGYTYDTDPSLTTLMLGEEGGTDPTTMATGEESVSLPTGADIGLNRRLNRLRKPFQKFPGRGTRCSGGPLGKF